MPVMFLLFSGYLAWLGSSNWGWTVLLAWFSTVVPHVTNNEKEEKEKEPLSEKEQSLIDELRKNFKNGKDDDKN
jgi:hypothetical protein